MNSSRFACRLFRSAHPGLPNSLFLLYLSFHRKFFWTHHQRIMTVGLAISGSIIIFDTGLLQLRPGYGSLIMYIMSIYQYHLVFFSTRAFLCIFMCVSYYLLVSLFSVDFGDEFMTFGQTDEWFRIDLNDPGNTYNIASELSRKPAYDNMTFSSVGYNRECQMTLQKETFHFLNDMDLNQGQFSNWSDVGFRNVSNMFLEEALYNQMRTRLAFWQIINPIMAAYYFFNLIILTFMLMVPGLMGEYHERVCYNKEVKQAENSQHMDEQQKFEDMLLKRLLPPEIVPILPEKRAQNEVVADRFESVSILFCDMVGFTKFSSELDPSELMVFLSALYAKYSAVVSDNSLYTVEVIGDALLAVAGCPKRIETEDHASRALKAAFELIEVTKEFSAQIQVPINIRVGVHSGQVIAGVVGVKDPRYHLFGEAVKVVEMMESSGEADRVQCSQSTYANLFAAQDVHSTAFRQECFFQRREELDEKTKRKLEGVDYGGCTYFVKPSSNNKRNRVQFRRLTLGRGGSASPSPKEQAELQKLHGIDEGKREAAKGNPSSSPTNQAANPPR